MPSARRIRTSRLRLPPGFVLALAVPGVFSPRAEFSPARRLLSAAGALDVRVKNAERFHPWTLVGIGMDRTATFEVKKIREIAGTTLVFDEPLGHAHEAGEIVSAEFVRYRWFPDVQFGTAYFHDHVDALTSWRHGLFGALIAEPPGSTYHHPRTAAELRSGPVADIHTASKVSADISGSFRELVMFIQDNNPLT